MCELNVGPVSLSLSLCRVKELNGLSKASSAADVPQSPEVSMEDSSSEEVSPEPSPTTTGLKSVIKHLEDCKVFQVFHRLLFCVFVLFPLTIFSVSPRFRFTVSRKVVLFSEFVHFFQVVHFIGIYLLVVISHDSLYFCSVSCYSSFSISNSVDLSLLPFFLHESG